MTKPEPCKSVAIVGGGQLGFFLCQAARELGLITTVVSADSAAPAVQIADNAILADADDPDLGAKIAACADVVTFETEVVSDELLTQLDAQRALGQLNIHPDTKVMRLIRNKARQKEWLQKQGFPTLPYLVSTNPRNDRELILQRYPVPFVQKAQQDGYDGYGVQIIDSTALLAQLWPVPSIIEPFLADAREIAVVCARGADGTLVTYPPVGLEFDPVRNVLDVAIAPANLPAALTASAVSLATDVVGRLNSVGVFAVEMFISDNDELLINEVSPRVHNTGHFTLEMCRPSQFEQHMRAVACLPLPAIEPPAAMAVMQNLLYADELAPLMSRGPGRVPVAAGGVNVWWYGKRIARPGRKMGHITAVAADTNTARKNITAALEQLSLKQTGVANG